MVDWLNNWSQLLVDERWGEAVDLFIERNRPSVDDLQAILQEVKVCSASDLDPTHVVFRFYEEPDGIHIEYSIPADGDWSPWTLECIMNLNGESVSSVEYLALEEG